MIVYPAIDLLGGQVVRLRQGDYGQATVYDRDPVAVAARLRDAGAEWIHVVDLEAARSGRLEQSTITAQIKAASGLRVQTGGGVRSLEVLAHLLDELKFDRVVLGTSAVSDPDFVAEALRRYDRRVAIGIDARDGRVAVRGWTEASAIDAIDLARRMSGMGAKTIIYTDIARDGMLSGPPLQGIRALRGELGVELIASGGVARPEDLGALAAAGADGVIVGKALYEQPSEWNRWFTGTVHAPGTPEQAVDAERLWRQFKKDPQGLVPAIVCDAADGAVLMLAYLDRQALELTLRTGLMHYYSRSRGRLWKKGESSGHYQQIRRIRVDCDGDALLVDVIQTGVACHTGNRSCFYRELEEWSGEAGDDSGKEGTP